MNSTRCNRIAIVIPIARRGGSVRTNCGSALMSNVRLRCKSKFATLWLMQQEPLDRSSDINALIESLRVQIQQFRQRLAELEEKHQRELELCRVVSPAGRRRRKSGPVDRKSSRYAKRRVRATSFTAGKPRH